MRNPHCRVTTTDPTSVAHHTYPPTHLPPRLQVDFFNEVSIMEGLAGSPRAAQLLDYGIDTRAEVMFLVMHDYRCSLRCVRNECVCVCARAHMHACLCFALMREGAGPGGAL